MKTKADFPSLLLNLLEAKGLARQDLRDIDQLTAPPYLASVSHVSNQTLRIILNRWQFFRIRPWRRIINSGWSFSVERLMRPLDIVLFLEAIKMALLSWVVWLRRNIKFQGSMHPFMAPILAGLAGLNPFRADTQLNPPLGQLTETSESQRGKGSTVVCANGLRQAIAAKCPLNPGPYRGVTGVFQSAAQQQITGEVVRERERITAAVIAQSKVPFEIRTPDLIGSFARAERFIGRCHMAAFNALFDQAGAFKNLTGGGICWPFQLRTVGAQIVEYLFGAPALAIKFGLDNHFTNFFRALVWVMMRRAGKVFKIFRSAFLMALNPFVSGGATDPIRTTQLRFRIPTMQIVGDKLYSFSHGTGLLPRHRQGPPCLAS